MSGEFRGAFEQASAWADRALLENWLTDRDLARLRGVETASANELFVDQDRRPLIVAFFGGTGVGKSSLLNRLAGHPVAPAGVRRPTSTHATLYVHRDQTLQGFPQGSPVADTRVEHHDVAARRDVAWLDMPDIDSVEARNKSLVLSWLPYVDWLIYVVSPERYRDDVGWRLLEERHRKHHWLFVINRWDEARGLEIGSFESDLRQAGFEGPRVLRTSCATGADDDFDKLEEIINSAIREHGLQELQRIGVLARLEELNGAVTELKDRLGTDGEWDELCRCYRESAEQRLDTFEQRLGAELDSVAALYPAAPPVWRTDPTPPALPDKLISGALGSSYASSLIEDLRLDLTVRTGELGVSGSRVGEVLDTMLAETGQVIRESVRSSLQDAVSSPAGVVRVSARRTLELLSYVLPALTGAWAAWTVVSRYQEGLSGEGEFLGVNFAVHSVLMIGLSWFVPFLLARLLRPSLRAAARRGIQAGLHRAADSIREKLQSLLGDLSSDRRALLDACPEFEPLRRG